MGVEQSIILVAAIIAFWGVGLSVMYACLVADEWARGE